jgi:hypothetical protein
MLLLLSLATIAAGCGGEPRAAPRKPVLLTLTAPQDGATTRDGSVVVRGRVSPLRSRVLVMGARVGVSEGRFETTVDLREGTNVIDVGAAAPGARATWRAVRVIRHSKIRLPDVVGSEPTDATAALEGLGFRVKVSVDDDLLDAFRRRPRIVCRSDPEAGAQLDPGSEVELVISKTC